MYAVVSRLSLFAFLLLVMGDGGFRVVLLLLYC
jgi:hypothetical protein